MKVYTHHPRSFIVDDPQLFVDSTKGGYWKRYPAYREALPKLQGIVGTTQFLWCELVPTFVRMSESIDLVRWEIEIPFNEILAFIHEDGGWKTLFSNAPAVDWSRLIVKLTEEEVPPLTPDNEASLREISCLIGIPVKSAKRIEMKPLY